VKWVGIGLVTAPHGVHGEVRVRVDTDFPERFEEAKTLTLLLASEPGDRAPRTASERAALQSRAFDVEGIRSHKRMLLLKLKGVDDRDAAEKLRNAEIVIRPDQVKPLPEGSWYIFDLEGLEVFDEEGRRLGVLDEVLQSAANDVYVVKGEREILIPAIKDVIREVDVAGGRMTVKLLEGL